MIFTKVKPIPIRSLQKQLLRALKQVNSNFSPLKTADPKIKILTFLAYFVQVSNQINKRNWNLDLTHWDHLLHVYLKMIDLNELKDTEINGDINQLIFLNTNQKKAISVASTYAQFIAKLVDVLLINDDVRNKKEELTTLMKLIMELFLINYLSPTLMRSAIKNLNNDYQKKVDAVVCQLAYITKIHKLLKSLLPNNINELVILINQLLKPINK